MLSEDKIQEVRAQENFPVASYLIPKKARKAVHALYDFARNADEIADSHSLPDQERGFLLKKLSEKMLLGDVNNIPYFARNYFRSCRDGEMNMIHGLLLLEAFIQDTEKKRYASWQDTLDYCRKSAATIGRSLLEATDEFSADLEASDKICSVLQLANHLQDVKEDYLNNDRIYFDETLISANDINQTKESDNFTRGKQEIVSLLKNMLQSSFHILKTINSFRVRAEIATIYNIADQLLNKLAKHDILQDQRVELSGAEKKKAVLKGLIQAIRNRPERKFSSSRIAIFSGSSFVKPLFKLKSDRRKAMFCFYSFCRLIDDATDTAQDEHDANLKLQQWQQEIDRIYATDNFTLPQHPISRELRLYVIKYKIEKTYFLEMLEGQKMDVAGLMRKPPLKILELYCYRVASCVGMISVDIFGYRQRNKQAIDGFAINLGKALQFVNIMRDVEEDLKKDRLYLPAELLENHGLAEISLHTMKDDYTNIRTALVPVLKDMAEMAETYFAIASEALPTEERQNMRAALLMKNIYSKYLDKMKVKDFVFERSDISLTLQEKLRIFFIY